MVFQQVLYRNRIWGFW